MHKLETVFEVDSPSNMVWAVLTDPSYLPKLYPDILTVEADPPGLIVAGQWCTLAGRVGSLKLKIKLQFTIVETESRLVSKAAPGGIFATFVHTVTLSPMGPRTDVKVVFEYSLSPQFLQRLPDPAVLENVVGANLRLYVRNLKEIAELLPLPK